MKNLIPNDVSRCTTHTCRLAGECKRYLQVDIDEHNKNKRTLHSEYEPDTDIQPCIGLKEID